MDGWTKPQRRRSLPEIEERIGILKAELHQLEAEAATLLAEARMEALVTARNIMRAHQLSVDDIL